MSDYNPYIEGEKLKDLFKMISSNKSIFFWKVWKTINTMKENKNNSSQANSLI